MKFKRIFSLILCVVITVSAFGTSVYASNILNPIDTENGEVVADFYSKLVDYIIKKYKYDITREELLNAAVKQILTDHPELLEEFGKGMFNALDENSVFYNAEEFESRYEDVTGVYVGIGINVYQDENKVILGEALEDSPAQGSGLEVGDIVVAVNGERVESYGLDKITSLIKGEEGTTVDITVLRNGAEYTYTLQRATIKINPISYEVIDSNIGYVKLSAFNGNAINAFDETMIKFGEMGIKTVVLDLRNNLGGYMSAAVAIASYFIPEGKLIASEEYKNEKNNIYHYAEKTKYKFNGVVLINEYSASASELVSGALKDYGAAIIVGQNSYGKGTVQTYDPLRSNHFIWYTVAEYYTPSHNPIHKVGIKPDYIVSNKYAPFDMNTVTPFEITRVLTEGCTGDDVYAVKERLKKLGYQIEVNDTYDIKTADIITKFQESTGLFPYGEADITTQLEINDVLRESEVLVDKQYERAINIAKNMY